ncbi:hypothetical protein X975_25791, partial [Stegodyphus mimosarum]
MSSMNSSANSSATSLSAEAFSPVSTGAAPSPPSLHKPAI